MCNLLTDLFMCYVLWGIVEAIVKPSGGREGQGNEEEEEEEEDPLDAFMSSLDEQVRKVLLHFLDDFCIVSHDPPLVALLPL